MKKFTHILSIILICTIFLCMFTACDSSSSGGSSSAPDNSYAVYLGAKNTIQNASALQELAQAYVKTFNENNLNFDDIDESLANAYDKQLKEHYTTVGFMYYIKGERYGRTVEGVVYGQSLTKDVSWTDWNEIPTSYKNDYLRGGDLSSYISDMDYYGMAVNKFSFTGVDYEVRVLFFAR